MGLKHPAERLGEVAVNTRVSLVLPLLAALLLPGTASAATPASVQHALAQAIAGPQRSPAHVARDRYRHPLRTLEFFGIRPDMTVVEVLPGGGWYTEILAPFLREHGTLIEATPPSGPMAARFKTKLADDPAVYDRVRTTPFAPPDSMVLGPPDSADMILTFRNMHDFMYENVHGEETDAILMRFFRSAFHTLKPGGVLGVVAHRAPTDMAPRDAFKLGRLPQAFLVAAAERAGFKLAAATEINANRKDPRTEPVWFLPPTLARGPADHYAAIGEADNMTLRFVKPQR
ncbi:MAG: class I SAM-dependent methyltransferase [Alphaproteobacteria bacterium]|nr:class I SAM-dependent methyltransferase [Alphaproteobacteria bacterium]